MTVVFIGMETSGALRRRFRALGIEAYSCDVLPAEDKGEGHIVGDVFDALADMWARNKSPALGIFHPTCTYLTISAEWAYGDGPYHQKVKPGTLVGVERRAARDVALNDVRRIMALPMVKIIENPIGVIGTRIRKPLQIVQPYSFGDDASKATCLWMLDKDGNDIPELRLPIDKSKRFPPRLVPRAQAMGRSDRARGNNGPAYLPRWGNQTDTGQNRLSPGVDRWKDRSRTFPGIADALVASCVRYLKEQGL